MAKYEERNRRSLEDLLREGKYVDIFRNPNNNNLVAIMDKKYLGIDLKVIEMVEEVADADEIFKNDAYKRLARQCSIAELREIDDHGNPVVIGFDTDTGKLNYAEFIPCLLLNQKTRKKVVRLDASLLYEDSEIEKNTNYSFKLRHMDNPTFEKVRDLSVGFYRELPQELQVELYEALNRGVDILEAEPQMTTYMYCFGKMHKAKLDYAFSKVPDEFFEQSEINIIDYGCGQAVGVMCYADFIHKNCYSQKVKRITLIEPSIICLKRAALHASVFFPDAEIKIISKRFDELSNEDIICEEEVPTLHIFSNVLDMICFDLDMFAELIKGNLKGENQFVCVSPYFKNHERDIRLTRFSSHFCDNAFGLMLDKRELVPDKEWTCALSVFSYLQLFEACNSLSTIVTAEDLADAVEDEVGAKYSKDGKRLLRIPNGITNYSIKEGTLVICDSAFGLDNGCGQIKTCLESIHLPASIRIIGKYLSGSQKLSKITVDENNYKFDSRNNCNAIIKTENNELLLGCRTTVIPQGVSVISDYAFLSCNELTSIDIPNSVISVGDGAFMNCGSLKQIFIPASVNNIGCRAFNGSGIEKVVVDKDNAVFDSRGDCNAIISKNDSKLIFGCINTTIPQTITIVGENAFECCDIKELNIPNSVTEIQQAAFLCCQDLHSVKLSSNLSVIEDFAFAGSGISFISIPNSVTRIGRDAFSNTHLKEVKAEVEQYNMLSASGFDTSFFIDFEDNHYLKAETEMTVEDAIIRFGGFFFNNSQNNKGEIVGVFSKGSGFSIDKRIYADLATKSDSYFAFYQLIDNDFKGDWYLTNRKTQNRDHVAGSLGPAAILPRAILGSAENQPIELSDVFPMGYINTKKRAFDQNQKLIDSIEKLRKIGPINYL